MMAENDDWIFVKGGSGRGQNRQRKESGSGTQTEESEFECTQSLEKWRNVIFAHVKALRRHPAWELLDTVLPPSDLIQGERWLFLFGLGTLRSCRDVLLRQLALAMLLKERIDATTSWFSDPNAELADRLLVRSLGLECRDSAFERSSEKLLDFGNYQTGWSLAFMPHLEKRLYGAFLKSARNGWFMLGNDLNLYDKFQRLNDQSSNGPPSPRTQDFESLVDGALEFTVPADPLPVDRKDEFFEALSDLSLIRVSVGLEAKLKAFSGHTS